MKVIFCASLDAPGGMRYTANEPYATHPTDTPADELFLGNLVVVVCERAVSFQHWSRQNTGAAISVVEHINRDGALDSWLNENWKGVRINFAIVEPRAAWSTSQQIASVVIERIETGENTRLRHVCRSAMEHMSKAVTRTYGISTFNEQLRNQTQPLVLGRVRWADPRPRRLNSVSVRGLYDVTDDVFEGIAEVRHRGVPQSANVSPLLTGGGYFEDQTECYGFRFGAQGFRLAAEVRGNIRREATITDDPAFATSLASWDVSVAGGSTITWISAGVVDMSGDNDTCRLDQVHTLVTGARYQLEVVIDNTTNSGVDLMYGATVLRTVEGITLRTILATFVAAAGIDTVGLEIPSSRTSTCRVTAIRVYPIFRIDSLSEVLRFCTARTGLSDADIDLTACAAIEAESPYRLAFATTSEMNGDVLARRAATSYGCALFQDLNGKIKPVRLKAPAAIADVEVFERQVLNIRFEDDTAPGLSTRMHYGENHVQHSDDDMSGITDPALRAELSNGVRVATSTVALHAFYAAASGRPPLDSMLSEGADALAEINRLNALYTVKRFFVSGRIRVDESTAPYSIQPGMTIKLWHHRFGFSASVNVWIALARSQTSAGGVDFVGWGTFDEEPEPAPGYLESPIEELIADPTFETSTGWSTDWLLEDGYTAYDGGVFTSQDLLANLLRATTDGKTYRLALDVISSSPGFGLEIALHGSVLWSGLQPSPGYFTVDLVAPSSHSDLYIRPESGGPISFDSVSFMELG